MIYKYIQWILFIALKVNEKQKILIRKDFLQKMKNS